MQQFLLAILFLLIAAGPLHTQPRDARTQWKELNLTETQKSTLNTIRIESKKEMIDLRGEARKKQLDLREMRDSEHADRSTVERVVREIADLRVRQVMLLHDADVRINEVLTPEQQKKWREIKRMRLEKRMRGMHDRDGAGYGNAMLHRDRSRFRQEK
ncbi:MAG: Spy/CpxP family protein refolding chaperone [Bacteroidetes bacterium]|nr:Spy/CpxP family protein refolding chaperone [Bacteroidota bacterium]